MLTYLVEYHQQAGAFNESDGQRLRDDIGELAKLFAAADWQAVNGIYKFRSKRIAHLTDAKVPPALIGETKKVCHQAITMIALVENVFLQAGFNYDVAEAQLRNYAEETIKFHFIDREKTPRQGN